MEGVAEFEERDDSADCQWPSSERHAKRALAPKVVRACRHLASGNSEETAGVSSVQRSAHVI